MQQRQCSTTTCNLGDSYDAPNLSAIPKLPAIAQRSEFARKTRDEGSRSTFAETVHPFLQHLMRIVKPNRHFGSDKLTALAGLATIFSPLLGPNYFTGLLEKSFLQQLCWQPASDTAFFSRLTGYRAPTWSWSSVDGGPLYFRTYQPDNHQRYGCEFVECQTTPKSQ